MVHLSAAGGELVDRIERGSEPAAGGREHELLERLADTGIAVPLPAVGDGPFTADDVTVVVPVRDRPVGLGRLLRALEQTAAPSAVVVVDDGSVVPVAVGGECLVLRNERPLGPGGARNRGVAAARTPLVAFIDSDCEPEPGWLEQLLAHFAREGVVAVAPRVVADAASVPRGIVSRALLAHDRVRSPLDLGDRPASVRAGTRVSYVPAAALLVRTDAFRDSGGFDPSMPMGEDVDLVWRIRAAGGDVRYEPRAHVRHAVRSSFRAWVAQRVGYGTSAAALERRHPGAVAPAVMSRWSALVWALAAAGRPLGAVTVAAVTVPAAARRLPRLPISVVARLVVHGHLTAGRQLARSALRVWWPVVLPSAVVSRRMRRVAAVSLAMAAVSAWPDPGDRSSSGPPPRPAERCGRAVLAVLDDLAYGAGVWIGCARERSAGPLLPRVTGPRTPGRLDQGDSC
jgi:mycofactocin glycosyltransferase